MRLGKLGSGAAGPRLRRRWCGQRCPGPGVCGCWFGTMPRDAAHRIKDVEKRIPMCS